MDIFQPGIGIVLVAVTAKAPEARTEPSNRANRLNFARMAVPDWAAKDGNFRCLQAMAKAALRPL